MKCGRPLKYNTPEEMQAIIDQYFSDCAYNRQVRAWIKLGKLPEEERETLTDDCIPTVTGLALALDLTRKSLISYEGKDEFVNTVKKAKGRVEAFVEQRLMEGGQAAGPIFNLKNNFEWKDKTEQEISGHLSTSELTDEQLDAKIRAKMAQC